MLDRQESPWAVFCFVHGKTYLTKEEYVKQMMRPDSVWVCPICGEKASWDDENYEYWMDLEYNKRDVFKVQWPVVSTDPDAPIYIYNKDRSVEVFFSAEEQKAALEPLRGPEGHISFHKHYLVGFVDDNGVLHLEGIAEEQDPGW